jgi:pimeloyl-ACP methyl ester carboxylesterase
MTAMKRAFLTLILALALAACSEPTPIGAMPAQPAVMLAGSIERQDLRFPCGATLCAAWLYLPPGQTKPPVVIMAHGFAGTRDVTLPAFAEHFARAGIAALVFDYRSFGASGGAPRQLVDPWKHLDDWRAALAFARSHPQIDGTRVALWGTSLGGGLALVTGASDGNVRAVVAQVPQIDSNVEGEATFPGVFWVIRLLFTAWGGLASEALGTGEWTIPAIARSDGFGMIVDDRAYEAAERGVPANATYRNEVVAHSIFTFDDYNPAVQATAIKAPVLLIAARADRFAPFVAAEAFAKTHPNVTLTEIDGDHFDIYAPPGSLRAAELATQFLDEHLSR